MIIVISKLNRDLVVNIFPFVILPFYHLSNGDGRHEVSGVGSGGDIVLLLLSLVLSYYQSCGARAGEVGDDGRAHGHDEILDECFHVWVHTFLLPPFNFPSSYKKRTRRTRIGTWSLGYNLMHLRFSLSCLRLSLSYLRLSLSYPRHFSSLSETFSRCSFSFFQLEKYFSPTRKVIFQRFLNHDAKIQKQPPAVMRWRLMP